MSLEDYLHEHYTADTARSIYRRSSRYRLTCPEAETAAYKDILLYIGALRTRYT